MDSHFERASVLLQQGRFDLAEKELRQVLADDPEHPVAHAYLSMCLSQLEKFKEATEEAKAAIGVAPDSPLPHYALATVLYDRNRFAEAAEAVTQAIELDPEDADCHALLAQIRLSMRRWQAALEAAETGLEMNAEHVRCTNVRAIALIKLGRREEAGETIDAALARDPENAESHANLGWALIEKGEPEKALEHFREALRLEPDFEWARLGIIEALRARHLIYSLLLKYFLFMSKLSGKAQWGIILGLFFGYRILLSISQSNPEAAPYIWPVLVLYIAFVFMSWTARHLFNLILRLNRFGRHALSRRETMASNFIGVCFLISLASLIAWLWSDDDPVYFLAMLFSLALVLPISASFMCTEGWPQVVMWGATSLIGLSMIAIFLLPLLMPGSGGERMGGVLINVVIWGVLLSQIGGNILAGMHIRK